MPVLDYICARARKMDQSLSMHFVKKVLELVHGPYSRKFVEGMEQMVQEIIEVIKKTDTEPVVRAWIDEVLAQPIDIEMHTPPPPPPPSVPHHPHHQHHSSTSSSASESNTTPMSTASDMML
ncbi:hypothetical protein BGW38_009390, partial [Lunasporangiospora selenospora]